MKIYKEIKSPVLDILLTGRQSATIGEDIASLLNWELRDVTREITRLRRKGVPICANSVGEIRGYYLAETQEELDEFCKRFKNRLSEIKRTLAGLEKYQEEKKNA